MKKSIIKIIALMLTIFIIFFISILLKNENDKPKEIMPFEWKAEYIWPEDQTQLVTPDMNTWSCFRKEFVIENKKDIENCIARIAVDSKYWLYINDEIVIREGGLKRGEKPDSIYYDEVDISKYLKKGENTISILVWHFGITGFSHIDSTKGALLFQVQIGDNTIKSDSSWKSIKHPAYLKDLEGTNGRLSETSIYYDSNLEIENWYKTDFNDESWDNACVQGKPGDMPWGELVLREIPQFLFSEIKEYENFEKYKNYVTEKDELLVMELPYNMQLTPYLKIEAEKNQKIYISLDENYGEEGKNQRTIYITKNGVQEFESLAWVNGDKIYYYIPKGIKILSLGYRHTGYDTTLSGKFESDNEMFNKLWNMANKTLYINMRDNYMDCPDRERAMWIGDNSVSMQEAMYGLDTKANLLYEKSVKTQIGWRYDKILMSVIPPAKANMHLPVQSLIGVNAMYDYYLYNGNKDFLQYMYPYAKDYLNVWAISETTGLAEILNYDCLWRWGDSSDTSDYFAIENAAYYFALDSIYKMAVELGNETEITEMKTRVDNFAKAYNEKYWDGTGYKDKDYKEYEGYDVRANALAVISGLASEDKYDAISKILVENTDNSTFMEKYVLEALCLIGKTKEAQKRIENRYSIMVNDEETTTLWEYWEKDTGTTNHAWAGGPLIIMSKYFAGISPEKPGYDVISIKPDFGNLTEIKSVVNTNHGRVELNASKKEELILKVNVPKETIIAVEKISENPIIKSGFKTIYENGNNVNTSKIEFSHEDEKYIYFNIVAGKYTIKSK